MSENRSEQSLRDSAAPKLRNYEHVGKVRKYRAVRDDASECDLPLGGVRAETQRMADRTLDGLTAAAFGPIRSTQELVHQRDVDATRVARNLEFHGIPSSVNAAVQRMSLHDRS